MPTTNIQALITVAQHLTYVEPIFRAEAQRRQAGFVVRHLAQLEREFKQLGKVPFDLADLKSGLATYQAARTPENWDNLKARP